MFHSIIVPTVDSARAGWLVDTLVTHHRHVLCVGETGTGKSVLLTHKLMNGLNPAVFQPIFLAFSARTSANATQDTIDARMARRRRGVYGPPLGQKFVVFVDDLNMPAKETYGAQPPIELLRQWMDSGGWYDRRDRDQNFMELADLQFVAAMGPPGGGRSIITARYVRHFNVLGLIPLDGASLRTMFNTIVSWSAGGHVGSVKSIVPDVVAATVDLYTAIAGALLPTPAKSHYTFNLRDLSKVFIGMHAAGDTRASGVVDEAGYLRLWRHECE